jgi:PAS domain S-box-containing protein/putative nucleotidyltransferase with HDIG domain
MIADFESGRILYVNARAIYNYGYSRSNFLKKRLTDLLSPDDCRFFRRRLRTTAGFTKKPAQRTCRLNLKNRRKVEAGVLAWKIDHMGKPALLLAVQDASTDSQAYKELLLKENELRATLYSIGDAVISTDRLGRVVRMNPVAERLTGWPERSAKGKPVSRVFKITNELTRKPAKDPVRRILREGVVIGLANHTILVAKNGRQIPIADAGAPILDDQGKVIGVVLVFRDQTAERRAQKAVAEARDFAQSIVETMREPMLVLDRGLRIVTANPAYYRLFCKTPGRTIGRSIFEVSDGGWNVPELRRLLKAILPKNTSFEDFEMTADFPRIGRRIILLNGRRLYHERKKTDKILLAFKDVTEKKAAEAALRQSESRFMTLADTTATAIFVYREKFLYANKAAEALSGYTQEELRKLPFWQVVHPEFRDMVKERGLARQRGEPVPSHYQFKILRKDGKPRWIDFTGGKIDWLGRPAGIGTAVDISDLLGLRQNLIENERFLKNVFTSIKDGLSILDSDLNVISVNPVMEERYSFSMPIVGKKCYQAYHKTQKPCLRCPSRRTLESGRPDYELITDAHGHTELYTYPLVDSASGRTTGVIEYVRDVTEKVRAELAAREQEEMFRVLADTTNSGIIVFQDERFIYCNPAVERLTGYSRDELLRMKFWEIVHPDFRDMVRERGLARQRGERPPSIYELKFAKRDGGESWVLVSAAAVSWGGRPAVISTITDISELKASSELVRTSREMLRSFVEATPDLAFIKDDRFRYVMVNAANARFFGLAAEEVAGKTDFQLMPRRLARKCRASDRQALESEGVVVAEERTDVGVFETIKFRVRLPDGRLGLGGYARDITEKKRTEQALRESEERFRRLAENAQDLIYRYTFRPRRGFEFVNDAATAVTGYTPEEHYADPDLGFKLVHPEDRHILEGYFDGKGAFGEPVTLRWIKKDGTVIWTEQRNVPVCDENGRVVAIEGIARDITARKRSEAELRQLNQDLERRLREMIIVHELSRRLLSLRSAEETGRAVAGLLKDLPNYDRVEVFQVDAPTGRLVPVIIDAAGKEMQAFADELAAIARTKLRVGRGITGAVAETGDTIIVDDVKADHRYIEADKGVYSEICVPLKLSDGRVTGVLNIESRSPACFSDGDARFLETVASLTAAALENARLFEETERRAVFLTTLNEITADSEKLSGDLAGLLDSTLSRLLDLFRVEKGGIWVHGRDEDMSVPPLICILRGLPDDAADAFFKVLTETGTAADKAISFFSPDDLPSPALRELAARYGVESGVLVPMKAGAGQIGGAVILSPCVRLWTSDEISLLETMAGQIGLVVERAMLDAEKRRRLAELETINRVSTALRTAANKEEMLPILLDNTLEVLGTDSGSIWLYDPNADLLKVVVSRGWFTDLDRFHTLSPEKGATGHVFQSKEPYIIPEFAEDPLIPADRRTLIPRGWSGAIIPIKTETDVWGGMTVSLRHPRRFSRDEVRLLGSLAEMAGTALHRMQLFEETRQRLSTLQSLQAIDRAIISSLDLNLTLEFILEHIVGQLRADAVGVLLFNKQGLALEPAAGRGFQNPSGYKKRTVKPGDPGVGQVVFNQKFIYIDDAESLADFVRRQMVAEEGFLGYAAAPLVIKSEVRGVLEVFFRKPPRFDKEWTFIFETLTSQAAIAVENSAMFTDLQRSNLELALAYDATIEGWAYALDLRDRETEHHTERVTDVCLRLAREMRVDAEALPHIRRGALLHDIGKMGIPDSILLKPGALTEDEWAVMKAHPEIAFRMLSRIEYLRPALDIPYCHHEKWDGTGYPRGLKGEEIPLAARIFAVVDVYDALTSDRPYRKAWTHEKAVEYVREQSGRHFDPQVVEAFLRILEDIAPGSGS